MPQLGETVTEGTILRWAKQVGDVIAEDEVLLEISTDKVDTEVPSPVSGTILDILVPEGETVAVGVDLVVIGEAGESTGEASPEQGAAVEMAPEVAADLHPASETLAGPDTGFEAGQAAKLTDDEVEAFFAEPSPAERTPRLLSPVVRRLIREHDLDVAQIAGTGQGGRVTRRDVEAYISSNGSTTAAPPIAPAEPTAPAPAEVEPI
ncbi:MAG: biotin/lipoyl-containing protein, partial [Acidimicrobiia bacterium]